MNSPVIRPATLADLNAIAALETAAFPDDAFSRRQLRYLISRARGAVLVLEEAGEVLGYISLLLRAGQSWCRIYSLAVAAACRGRGLAGILLDAAEHFARQRGLKTIFLEVNTQNKAANALYARRGFKLRFIKPDYYHNGDAAFFMSCPVPPRQPA